MPLKFNALLPKSSPPNVVWFIVTLVAACLWLSFMLNTGLVSPLELMTLVAVSFHSYLAVALALSVIRTVML